MNTTVKFPIAKLLKEKGFDVPCLKCYLEDGEMQISSGEEGDFEEYNHNQWDNYSAPTITDVVMWFYEKHGIWIVAWRYEDDKSKFYFEIDSKGDVNLGLFNSPTEAYEAAIEYCLTNLI